LFSKSAVNGHGNDDASVGIRNKHCRAVSLPIVVGRQTNAPLPNFWAVSKILQIVSSSTGARIEGIQLVARKLPTRENERLHLARIFDW
jgi:hypothetical protein